MRIVRNWPALEESARGASIAIGNFDGLHKGHQAVLAAMMQQAEALGAKPAVMTFEPHPRRFFNPDAPVLRLFPLHHKLRLLQLMGVEIVYALRFNAEFAKLSAEQFMQEVLVDGLGARAVVTGDDFCFGKKRMGSRHSLSTFAEATGAFAYEAVGAQKHEDTVYSSSTIRDYVQQGEMQEAARLLGRPYSIRGRVQHGDKRGREMGFPTANIAAPRILKPRYGVYAVRAILPDGSVHQGVANWGKRPTVGGLREWLEVHLFDVQPDLYGQEVEITFATYLRDEQAFAGLEELKTQIARDCDAARTYFAEGRAA